MKKQVVMDFRVHNHNFYIMYYLLNIHPLYIHIEINLNLVKNHKVFQ